MAWKVVDLFSGADGMSLGFVDPRFCGGFETVLAVDNDEAAIATHQANFSGDAVCGNVETWLIEADIPHADVVVGGPPCQGFSLLNKNREGDALRALWEPFLDVVARSGALNIEDPSPQGSGQSAKGAAIEYCEAFFRADLATLRVEH